MPDDHFTHVATVGFAENPKVFLFLVGKGVRLKQSILGHRAQNGINVDEALFAKIERYAESLGMGEGLLSVLLHDFDDGYGFRHDVSIFRFWR